jgi:hypothetical protein
MMVMESFEVDAQVCALARPSYGAGIAPLCLRLVHRDISPQIGFKVLA